MNDLVTYEDLPAMGVSVTPSHIRVKVRHGTFPRPVKGGGIDGGPAIGKHAKFYWRRKEVEAWISGRKKRKPPTT